MKKANTTKVTFAATTRNGNRIVMSNYFYCSEENAAVVVANSYSNLSNIKIIRLESF